MTRSPEQSLLLACARVECDATARGHIESLMQEEIHWPRVLDAAERHGLAALLNRHLSAVAPERVPRPVMVDLWTGYERRLRHNRKMARELLRVLDAFEAAGIDALPYKGPTLAASIYADVGLREFGDLDILLRAQDVPRAKRCLEALGYASEFALTDEGHRAAMASSAQYHVAMRGPGAVVELHWKTDPDFPVERGDDDWWRGLARVGFEGGVVRAFSPEEMFLVLCLHGAKHRWASLAWVVDVAEMMRAPNAIDWERIAARADAMHARRRCLLGVRLAHDLLGAPVPAGLGDALSNRVVGERARDIAVELLDPSPHAAGAFTMLARELALYDRPSQRLRHVFHVIAAPGIAEWSRWHLPRPLAFLYFPLRVARLAAKHLARL
jgi:hypothetical protein